MNNIGQDTGHIHFAFFVYTQTHTLSVYYSVLNLSEILRNRTVVFSKVEMRKEFLNKIGWNMVALNEAKTV